MAVHSDDPLRDFLARLLAAIAKAEGGGIDEGMAREIERQMRRDWAGSEPYIAADPDREARRRQAEAELARGRPVGLVARKTGMSRSTLYGLLKRRG